MDLYIHYPALPEGKELADVVEELNQVLEDGGAVCGGEAVAVVVGAHPLLGRGLGELDGAAQDEGVAAVRRELVVPCDVADAGVDRGGDDNAVAGGEAVVIAALPHIGLALAAYIGY